MRSSETIHDASKRLHYWKEQSERVRINDISKRTERLSLLVVPASSMLRSEQIVVNKARYKSTANGK